MSLPDAVVVFGATGFVGRNLVAGLAGAIPRIIAVSRSGAPVEGAHEAVPFDAIQHLSNLPPETAVIHLAAERYNAALHDSAQSALLIGNTAITNTVYGFCLEKGIREVRAASSVAVYPAGLDRMDDEEPVNLNSPPHANEAMYAWSKRWGEIASGLYADRYGINTVWFRLSNPYGPHDSLDPGKAHVLPAFVMRALGPEPAFVLRGNPNVERDFVYAGDVVSVFARSLEWRGVNDRLNLCSGSTTTLLTLAQEILRLSRTAKPLELAGPATPSGVTVRRSTNAKLRRLMGDIPLTSLTEGLIPTIAWYRDALA